MLARKRDCRGFVLTGVRESGVVGAGPSVGGGSDGWGAVATNVAANARLGLGLGIDQCREVGGERGRPVRSASGIDVDREIQCLEQAGVLYRKVSDRHDTTSKTTWHVCCTLFQLCNHVANIFHT